MNDLSTISLELELNGFSIVRDYFANGEIAELIGICTTAESGYKLRRRLAVFAVRDLLQVQGIRELAQSEKLRALVRPLLGERTAAVKGTFFDKISDANWKVPYHQDLTIAVKSRIESPDYGPWSTKAGIVHVQPPIQVLEQMLAIRIHLDDCFSTSGPLRVLRGTHRIGRCSAADIDRLRTSQEEVVLEVSAGDVILMRPLLLHASSVAKDPRHRRVVHLEFAGGDLPGGVVWKDSA
jgi:Phytanoyl-CoA dioxygenase (PhyH)